jgi:hypothetical protein
MVDHMRRQRKTSPLTTLKAVLAAAGVVDDQIMWLASSRASVMSTSPLSAPVNQGSKRAARLLAMAA